MSAVALRLAPFRAVFGARVASYRQWIVIVVVALIFVGMPQLPNNDWQRNAADLPLGTAIYHDPAYVYPPWALVLLYPFYLLTAAGSRVATVLLIGWLAQRRGWSLGLWLSIVISPLFLWTMVLSSADVLVLLIPILLWEMGGRWRPALRGLALAILLLKPQVALLLIAYWLWTLRRQPRDLLLTLATAVAITLPISMIGSPPLLAQWFANLTHPVAANLDHWVYNNLSLTYRYGLAFGVGVVTAAFGGLFVWMRRRHQQWTADDCGQCRAHGGDAAGAVCRQSGRDCADELASVVADHAAGLCHGVRHGDPECLRHRGRLDSAESGHPVDCVGGAVYPPSQSSRRNSVNYNENRFSARSRPCWMR